MGSRKEKIGTVRVSARPERGMPLPPNRIHRNRKRAAQIARKGRFRQLPTGESE